MVTYASAPERIPLTDGGAYGPQGRAPWLDIDWREHQRWVTVGGDAINTIDLGEGPALVFVHGLSGSWPNWLEQLPAFADPALSGGVPHRVITMDLPGFGHSPMPRQEISIRGYARMLDGLLGELGVDSATVVGNSMGGFISGELAIGFPERVQRLVLVSAAGISTHGDPRTERAMPTVRRVNRMMGMAAAWMASRSDAATRRARLRDATLGVVLAHPSQIPAALAAEQVRGAGKPGFLEAFEAVVDYDISERLPEIACPTLIVWGERDRLINVRDAAVFEQLIPDSRAVVYADTGHMSMLERPAAFNALLSEFIAEGP